MTKPPTAERLAMARRIVEKFYDLPSSEVADNCSEIAIALAAIIETTEREEADKATLRRTINDGLYMLESYRQMLGEKGRQVAKMWSDQGLIRQHSSWAVDPYSLSGEEVAGIHIEREAAPKTRIENLDTDPKGQAHD